MIEAKRYNNDGKYVYQNNDGRDVKIDAYVLVRVTVEPDMTVKTMKFTDVSQLKKDRTISVEILGGISHNDFWEKKHYVTKGIKCTCQNLRAICDGKKELPNKIGGCEKKAETLQQDNYILYKDKLNSVASILKHN